MKYLVGIISVLVVVVLVGSVMVPIINDSTGGGVEYEDNPDWAGWVRFDLNTSAGATYQLGMWQDENGIYVDNILDADTDRQIYDDSTTGDYETIMYADSNMVVWSIDDTFNVQGLSGGKPVFINAPILDIIRTADGVEVVTDTDSVTFDAPTWAYVPHSGGKYGFYSYDESRGVEHPANAPLAILSDSFANVVAYNNVYKFDGLGLEMDTVYQDGKLYGATWHKPTTALDDLHITPINPGILQPSGGETQGSTTPINPDPIDIDDPFDDGDVIMTVPTPDYTDGDWGYNLMTVSGVTYAKIVSYSGSNSETITIPATVGGYDVYELGRGGSVETIFSDSLVASNLIISDGIQSIAQSAFYGAPFTGKLTIPDSVTSIGNSAFRMAHFTGILKLPSNVDTINTYTFGQSSFTGDLVLPNGVTTVKQDGFGTCLGLSTIVIPKSVTTIGNYAFERCTNLGGLVIMSDAVPGGSSAFANYPATVEVLDLSDAVDYSVNRYGISADAVVSESLNDCFGFVSIVSTAHGTPGGMGEYSNLIYAIPIVIISALLVAFGAFVIRRDY